jgi:hypothetical protein
MQLMDAKTPEEIDLAIRKAGALGGQDAAAHLAEYYGKPLQIDTAAETERIANDPMLQRQGAVAKGGNLAYDKDKGVQALNRVLAMADPKDYKPFMEGERIGVQTDATLGAAATQTDPVKKAEMTQRLLDPNSKQEVAQIREAGDLKAAQLKASGKGGGSSNASNIFKTISDDQGNAFGIRRDGSKVDLGIKTDTFNKQVAAQITKMADSESGFRKLTEEQKRERAIERLTGNAAPAASPAAPAGKSEVWVRDKNGKLVRG